MGSAERRRREVAEEKLERQEEEEEGRRAKGEGMSPQEVKGVRNGTRDYEMACVGRKIVVAQGMVRQEHTDPGDALEL